MCRYWYTVLTQQLLYKATSASETVKMAAGAGKTTGWTPHYAEKTKLQLLGKDYKWGFGFDRKRRKLHNMARNLASRLSQLGLMLDIPVSYIQARLLQLQSFGYIYIGLTFYSVVCYRSELFLKNQGL